MARKYEQEASVETLLIEIGKFEWDYLHCGRMAEKATLLTVVGVVESSRDEKGTAWRS